MAAAVREVKDAQVTEQVLFDSFSPALLYLASQAAPEIPRELDLDGLQLLNPAQIEAVTGLPVTIISKKISLGLTWADIGPIYRLPGYASPGQFLATAMAVQARAVGGEMDFFGPAEQLQPGSGAAFVAAAHSLGLRAFADPANVEADWDFFASFGVDAIYSTIPMGVNLQPAIPDLDGRLRPPQKELTLRGPGNLAPELSPASLSRRGIAPQRSVALRDDLGSPRHAGFTH